MIWQLGMGRSIPNIDTKYRYQTATFSCIDNGKWVSILICICKLEGVAANSDPKGRLSSLFCTPPPQHLRVGLPPLSGKYAELL